MANEKIEQAIEERRNPQVNTPAEDVDIDQEEQKLNMIRKLSN